MSQKKPTMPNSIKFMFGGLAGMGAALFVQPLDLLKNRKQMSGMGGKSGKSLIAISVDIFTKEGVFAFYNGLTAGLLRQATYTTGRLGVYTWLFETFSGEDGTPPGFIVKTVFGLSAGLIGSFIGTPADVALVRMTSDGRLPASERRNYKHVVDALIRITKEEGVTGLFRGVVPTMGRAMLVNGSVLALYSQSKEFLINSGYFNDNAHCHFWASMISGFVTSIIAVPVDIAKTRIQNMKVTSGKPEYSGAFDVIRKIIKHEGIASCWKGFTPFYFRFGPNTVLTFIFLEQLNVLYYSFATP